MISEIRRRLLSIKNEEKKIRDSLKIGGLSNTLLTTNIKYLSSSERKLLSLAVALLSNPDTIIIEEPFKFLDMKSEKNLVMLLQKIREQYNKTIVIVSNDSNILYKYTNHLIIEKNNKILVEGNTSELFQRVDFLRKNGIVIPDLIELTYLAKKNKNIKLEYHKDIRDIIKDIYKHV